MTIDIDYGEYTLFDIEFYQSTDETKKGLKEIWYSELSSLPRVKGIAKFLHDKLQDTAFDVDEFIKDSEVIQELRGWLWELHDNKLVDMETSNDRHYKVIKPELDKIIDTYCRKYGFSISID